MSAANPGPWISNLGAAVIDGIKNHLWKAFKAAIKNWFEQKLTQILGIGMMIFQILMKGGIKLAGEQIDGSFDLDGQTYLVEAKFHREPIGPGPLREFRDKVEGAAAWSRGLFVSWSGFSPHSSDAMGRGKRTNIVGMTGQDLYLVLDGEVTLQQAIRMKARRAAETGEFFVSLQQLLMEQK